MTRKSKIARLPRSIRDELNRRLDNLQPGIRLVEWLNSLPEAKEILTREFEGHRITAQNLSEWKRGGYHDWVAQQECRSSLQDWLADAKELGEAASPQKLTEAIFTFVTVHYAAAMDDCWIDTSENRKNLEFWGRIVRDVVPLHQCDIARQRLELGEQRMDLDRQRLELDRARLDLARQKAGAQSQETPIRSADIPVRSPAHCGITDQETQFSSNAGAASPSPLRSGGEGQGENSPAKLAHFAPEPERGCVEDQPQQGDPPSGSILFENRDPFSLSHRMGEGRGEGWVRGDEALREHGASFDVRCFPIAEMASQNALKINILQPNPTKSNNPFFIFSQTTTVGQASRPSPISFSISYCQKPSATSKLILEPQL